MNERDFMEKLKKYASKYFYFGRSIGIPDEVSLLASYNVGRLYYEVRIFDGTNINWDFVFTTCFWISNKVLLDEEIVLKDLLDYVDRTYTKDMFITFEYFLLKKLGFDFGYKYIRQMYEEKEERRGEEREEEEERRGEEREEEEDSAGEEEFLISRPSTYISLERSISGKGNRCNIC